MNGSSGSFPNSGIPWECGNGSPGSSPNREFLGNVGVAPLGTDTSQTQEFLGNDPQDLSQIWEFFGNGPFGNAGVAPLDPSQIQEYLGNAGTAPLGPWGLQVGFW